MSSSHAFCRFSGPKAPAHPNFCYYVLDRNQNTQLLRIRLPILQIASVPAAALIGLMAHFIFVLISRETGAPVHFYEASFELNSFTTTRERSISFDVRTYDVRRVLQ